jgi:hypothetical protein
MTRPIRYAASFAALCALCCCARQSAPTGGPKDTQPPRVDSLRSTPNFSTNFAERRIRLRFDEWVTLSDVGTQVVVSPPFAKKPEVTLRGKTVTVAFDKAEQLRPNTTYTINFGTSVKDFHADNPAKDLRFVFSTGAFIDSLSMSGIVVDALTGEPVENVSVMLYDNLNDSVPRKERPYYFSRSDKGGQYAIRNVRAGVFKVVAIEDSDQNLRWDGENERVAFADSSLRLDSAARLLTALRLFKNQPRLRLAQRDASRYGLVKLGFNAAPDSVQVRAEVAGLRFLTEKNQDSLLVWYDLAAPTAWQLLAGKDTVAVKELSRENFLKNRRVGFADESPATAAAAGSQRGGRAPTAPTVGAPNAPPPIAAVRTVAQNPAKSAFLPFSGPLASVDTSRWVLTVDSVRSGAFVAAVDSASPRRARLRANWRAGKTYNLVLLPGAVTDFWGVANADTLRRNFTIPTEKQLGTLNLTLEALTPGALYTFELLNGTTLEEARNFVAETPTKVLIIKDLIPSAYTARLVRDANGNGQWDTGDYFARRQPELVVVKKLESLRANWELEATLSMEAVQAQKRRQ